MHVPNSMFCFVFTFPFRFKGFAGFRRLLETGYGQVQLEVFYFRPLRKKIYIYQSILMPQR